MQETADVVQQILGYRRRLEKYIERGNEDFKVVLMIMGYFYFERHAIWNILSNTA